MRGTVPVDEARLNRVLEGLSYQEYAGMDAINAHGLMDVLESPAHYRYRLKNPGEASPAMLTGIQVDMALFEPASFSKQFAVKERGAEVIDGVTYVTPLQMAKVNAIVQGVWANPEAAQLLESAIPQPTIVWQDRFHNVPCKARLDCISKLGTRRVAVDLKTTADSDPYKFAKKMADYRYDLQAAHYLEAGQATGAFDPLLFMFIVVQTKAPYTCYVYRAGDSVLSRGTAWRDHAMQIYTECLRRDHWPAPPSYQTIEMPYWAKTPDEEHNQQDQLEAQPPPPDDDKDA